jgi:IS30 family transposase
MFSKMPKDYVKSITYDNGTENAEHTEINRILKIGSYFCQPYHSWEKGTVENTNGLIRRFFPKGANFDNISDAQIAVHRILAQQQIQKMFKIFYAIGVFNSAVAVAA